MMKLIVASCLIAVASAAVAVDGPAVKLLSQTQDVQPDGSYNWAVQLDNGVSAEEHGSIKAVGKEEADVSVQGSHSWTSPEGEKISITYVADENGYQPKGSHIPEIPAAIQRALEWIAQHPEPKSK